jgi:hypothetical protein
MLTDSANNESLLKESNVLDLQGMQISSLMCVQKPTLEVYP